MVLSGRNIARNVISLSLAFVLLPACPGGSDANLCATVKCAPGRVCIEGACTDSCAGGCPGGTQCRQNKCQPILQDSGPTYDTAPLVDSAPTKTDGKLLSDVQAVKPDAKVGCGNCDDGDPCTVDKCVANVCQHETPVSPTCGNGTIDACEICEAATFIPLGKDQMCFFCNEIGYSYFMYDEKFLPLGNAFYSAQGNQHHMLVTCTGKRVITWIGGNCEAGSIYAKTGGIGKKSVTISCTVPASGHNKSTYKFRCGPPPK